MSSEESSAANVHPPDADSDVCHNSDAAKVHDAERALEAILLTGEGDPEAAHSEADKVLATLLKRLGHRRLVELWEAVPKWYA